MQVSGAGLEDAQGVANVGVRPTVDDSIKANLEVHLLDREINLYGKHIEVTFRHKLREERNSVVGRAERKYCEGYRYNAGLVRGNSDE